MVTNTERSNKFTASFPHLFMHLIFATPIGEPYSEYAKIILPFEWPIWISICALFIVTILTIYVLEYVKCPCLPGRNSSTILNMINIFLGGGVPQIVKRNSARMFLIVWLMSSLILRNAYQGSLFNFLQSQTRIRPEYTLEKIIESDYPVYAISEVIFENIPKLRK